MKFTTVALDYAKTTGAVLALAAALFFGYSIVGYVTDTFSNARAIGSGECSGCGGGIIWIRGGAGFAWFPQLDGGGGGGGGFEPYCTLALTQNGTQQYILSWTAPYATSFSIDHSIGNVTPATGGTQIIGVYASETPYIGTAVTPYGTVTCQTTYTPPPNPPYCSLIASPTTIPSGGSSTITWNTTSGVPFSVNNGVGSLTPVGGGSFVVSPATTTTYIGTVTGTNYQTAQCQTTVVVTPPAKCELEITKVANVASTTVGGQIEYTINVTNTGSAKCTGSGVKIEDVLDSRLAYVSETHSANITAGYGVDPVYTSGNRTLHWNGWDLDPAETGWIKVTVTAGTPTACSEVVPNKARITSYEYNNFLTWIYSSEVAVTVTKDCAPPPPQECKLQIVKAVNLASSTPGASAVYSINFKNIGNKKCTGSGVKVQDVLDPLLTYVSETHSVNVTAGYGTDPVYKSSDRTLRWNAWDLDPGEEGWVAFTATVGTPTDCSAIVSNTARITSYEYNNFTTWVSSLNITFPVTKNCQPPATCSHGYWKTHLFWYDANDPHDVLLLTQLNAQGPGSEALRESARAYLNAEYPDVECEDLPPPPPPQECTLEITKTTRDDRSFAPNENVEYTISVKNTGGKKCTGSGVKIQDYLDPHLTYISETHSANITAGYGTEPVYKSSNRTLYWNAWDLDPNESGWIKFVAKVGTPTSCTEMIHNKAKVTAYEYNNFTTWVESNTVDISVTKDCYVPVPYCTMSSNGNTITWNSTNTSSATIDQGIDSVALSGSTTVSPSVTTTYTGTFTGPGGTVTCNTTITTQTPVPQCTISLSASKITSGQSVMVSWTSNNVSQGFISSVGTTTPVSGGSQEVFPSDSTTFTGTFTGSYGTVTCQAPITVEKGGGGCSGNCGGGLNQPNVVMLQKPPEAPLAFVTLEQIPYTGFQAGKALTLAFWLAVGLLAAAVTYFVMGPGAVTYVMGNALTAAGIGRYDEYTEVATEPRPVPQTLKPEVRRDSAAYNGNGYAASVAAPAMTYTAPVVSAPTQDTTDLADVIESRAHAAGVLVSPEAVHTVLRISKDRGEVLRQFGEILNESVRTLPREDGWVMLTSERLERMTETVAKPVTVATQTTTPSVEAILNTVMPPQVPKTVQSVNVEMPMAVADDQSVVMSLAKAVLSGNRELAYATLRNLEASRAHAATVMTVVAGACDQLYRARRHGLTTELSVSAMDVTDETLAKIIEAFTHGMDQTYPNPFTSLKLAVAQAFEARG